MYNRKQRATDKDQTVPSQIRTCLFPSFFYIPTVPFTDGRREEKMKRTFPERRLEIILIVVQCSGVDELFQFDRRRVVRHASNSCLSPEPESPPQLPTQTTVWGRLISWYSSWMCGYWTWSLPVAPPGAPGYQWG